MNFGVQAIHLQILSLLRGGAEVQPPEAAVEVGSESQPGAVGGEKIGGARVDLGSLVGQGVGERGEDRDVDEGGDGLAKAEEELLEY